VEPDLLSVLEAFIHADPRPPGFEGRLAVGLLDDQKVRWLLVELRGENLQTTRTDDRLAARGFDCIWLLPHKPGATTLPSASDHSLIDGDHSLLQKINDRYFKTRSHLGFQIQRITSARGKNAKKRRHA
jgi:hypothetical protein